MCTKRTVSTGATLWPIDILSFYCYVPFFLIIASFAVVWNVELGCCRLCQFIFRLSQFDDFPNPFSLTKNYFLLSITMPIPYFCLTNFSRSSFLQICSRLMVQSQPGTDYFVLSVCCCVRFLASLCYQEYSYIRIGDLTVWIVFPTVAIRMYRSSPLVPLDSCLTAAACLSSAC